MPCETSVVLIIFRRPHQTRQVFERIREVRPAKLFVVADGPRTPEEKLLCDQTRAVTGQIDWDCEVFRNFSDENMGARQRVSSGLDWVFEQVDEAIILEDDCLPHLSFFGYCDELLKRYREDDRVWSISGDNFHRGQVRGDGSYYFSNYFHGWGWATWKRAWMHYDHRMEGWPAFRDRLKDVLDAPHEVKYWSGFLDTLYKTGKPDAWDYIWLLTGWMKGGLTLVPNVNLVENIGFGECGTNTTGQGGWIADRRAEEIGALIHPAVVKRDIAADEYTFENVFPGRRMRLEQRWEYRFRRHLWRLKQKILGKAQGL